MREIACSMFRTHNAMQTAFKRRNIINGSEILLRFPQNRRMIAICVCLGLFQRWKTCALSCTSKMEWNERLNVVNISNGWEISLYYRQNRRTVAICEVLGLFLRWKSCALSSTSKMEWNERSNVVNISNAWGISLNYRKNRRMIAICVFLDMFRNAKSRAPCSARIMQWKQRLNFETS